MRPALAAPLFDNGATVCHHLWAMKMPLQQEILDLLRQKLLPEVVEIKSDLQSVKADIRIINGRLDQMDKRFEQVDKRFEQMDKRFDDMQQQMRDLKDDVREVRSFVFTGYLTERKPAPAVREKKP